MHSYVGIHTSFHSCLSVLRNETYSTNQEKDSHITVERVGQMFIFHD